MAFHKRSWTTCCVGLLTLAMHAGAATVTEDFSGTVAATLDDGHIGGIFASSVGATATGSFSFDTSAATAASGNTSTEALYYLTPGTVTMTASDSFGSFALSNPMVKATAALDALAGQNGWELYIPRNPADEPISKYFDVGLGMPLSGPVQLGTPTPPNGTVWTTALSFFPTSFGSGVIGYAQFAVINDPANALSYVDVDVTSLGSRTSTPEPSGLVLVGLAALLAVTRRPFSR